MSKSNKSNPAAADEVADEVVEAPPAPQPTMPAKGADSVQQLQKLLEELTPDQRERLQQAGVVVPEGDLESLFSGNHKFGLRCTMCNELALIFVGSKFRWAGVEYDQPPPVHHSQVAWFQNLEPGQIDRHSPKCQNCFHPVPLLRSGAFDVGRQRLQELSSWKGTRDVRFDRRKAKEHQDQVAREIATEGGGDQVDNSYNLKDVPVSRLIEQQHGAGILEQIDATMSAAGVTKALASGFKN